jgi:tRNA-dihydrouridine synthase
MDHLQDLGKFSDKVLSRMVKSAQVVGDRKAWRKFKEEIERRRRAAQLLREPVTDTTAACHKPLPKGYQGLKARCSECGKFTPLP